MKIGNVIREYRHNHGISMQEFADRCGLSKGYISMLEKGVHPQNNKEIIPSIETVQKIAKAMNLSVDALLSMVDADQNIDVSNKQDSSFVLDFHLFGEDRPDDVDSLFIEKYSQDVYDAAMMYNDLDVNGRYKVIGYMDSLSAEKGVKKEVKIKPPAKAAAGTVKTPVTPKPKTRSRGTRSKSVPPIQNGKGLKVAASKRPELSREEVSRLIAARSKAKSEKKK